MLWCVSGVRCESLIVNSFSRFLYLAYKSTDWHGTSHFLIWIWQLFPLNNYIHVWMHKIVCVYVCRSLQGGVFLLLPYLLFKASYNIYLRFVSPVPTADCQCVPLAVCVWHWFPWCLLTTLLTHHHFNRFSHWSNGDKLQLMSWRINLVRIAEECVFIKSFNLFLTGGHIPTTIGHHLKSKM